MDIESISDSIKEVNQDSLLVKKGIYHNKQIVLCAICDGVGGLEKGELASASVIMELSKWMDSLHTCSFQKIQAELTYLLKQMNLKLFHSSYSMGTTLTMVLFINRTYCICNIGDSRIYKINQKVELLTKDDVLQTGVLTKALGIQKDIDISFKVGKLKNECILLCSDGFYKKLYEEEFKKIYTYFPWQLQKYVQILRIRNELDDISVIALKYKPKS